MKSPERHAGGIIHTYQKYDPGRFPSPQQPPPDALGGAFEHLLAYGDLREFTEEELARAIHLDPSQIAGLGPSLESIRAMLLERKQKLLARYETQTVQETARKAYQRAAEGLRPPPELKQSFQRAFQEEQLRELERIWFRAGGERSQFAGGLLKLTQRLSEKTGVDELASRYTFTGREKLTVPEALELKEELEQVDRLLAQLEEALKSAQLAIIDLEQLAEYIPPEAIENLNALQQQVQDMLQELAESQGLERTRRGYQMTPKAQRILQSRLLEQIFSQLQASRSGRHTLPVVGEGAVEMQATKDYEFGDSAAQLDLVGSLTNALIRNGPGLPIRLESQDLQIHRTRNTPKCATVVLMDMSGSMRYGGLYIHVKRMGLALDGLIRREYPGDYLQFVEMYTFAKPRAANELVSLLPKPVTVYDPIVRLKADMSRPEVSEQRIPPHFTNIQHALLLGRRFLTAQDTPNRQIILITDGLPTAHFEGNLLYMLYPPDPATERATLREGQLCQREGITINIFLLASWSQSHEDVQFAYKLARSTKGRVFFTAGRDLERYVVWDFLARRRSIVS